MNRFFLFLALLALVAAAFIIYRSGTVPGGDLPSLGVSLTAHRGSSS